MDVLSLLKGKLIEVMTDMKVPVTLEIKEVKQNDHRDWTTYTVFFTNGSSKEYSSLQDIKLKESGNQ